MRKKKRVWLSRLPLPHIEKVGNKMSKESNVAKMEGLANKGATIKTIKVYVCVYQAVLQTINIVDTKWLAY